MKPITCKKCDKGLVKVHGQVCYACRLEEIEKIVRAKTHQMKK